ncbi:MAG: hypothetical protein LUP99_00040 [Methanomicrobiales archaeon]|nr:hypothetical protein [Methanomicrobiales archaeon]
MQETCPVCGSATRSVHPPRFSTVDRFEKYRKQVRQSRK